MFSARKKNPCYFCDIRGHFGPLVGFFFFKSGILNWKIGSCKLQSSFSIFFISYVIGITALVIITF